MSEYETLYNSFEAHILILRPCKTTRVTLYNN